MTSIRGSAGWAGIPQGDGPLKPDAPEISGIKSELDQLKSILSSAQGSDGSIDVADLEQRIENTGDPELAEQLEAIKDAFPKMVEREFSAGCGGGTTTRTVADDPDQLTRDQVQQVLSDLATAQAEASALDADGDGLLTTGELKAGAGTQSELVNDLLEGSLAGHKSELGSWAKALSQVSGTIRDRQDLDRRIVQRAGFHAATPQGAAALTAAYRKVLTQTGDTGNMLSDLDAAEGGPAGLRFLKWLPFFNDDGEGHLSDKEIGKFLGTKDLNAFAKETNDEILDHLGGGYETFLAGDDLEGTDQLTDPDFKSRESRFSSSCS
ncbi:MAG: hypothetical protein ACYTFT_02060 [Planctomycetota bacterium]|jgi:hypothetical protein